MKLLFVVQRYGREVAGGAELHCRQFASLLAARGHEVHALSSCAVSYVDWANEYADGDSWLDGVRLHRLPVARTRDTATFAGLDGRTVWRRGVRPPLLQRAWMDAQGPLLPGLAPWLLERATTFDVIVFFTYLYYTTWAGLPAASGRAATVLHPTAHREPQLGVPLFDRILRLPSRYAYSTEEEALLIAERTGRSRQGQIIGIGVDLDATGNGVSFRTQWGLSDRPYLLFVGRVVAEKGWLELYDYFVTYKRRRPGPLMLVVMGDPIGSPPTHPDMCFTGYVEEQTKRDALDGALALIQPSYFESFSMILSEAWAQRCPALVQGRCDVLAGQSGRSGGGIPYLGYPEFEAALDRLQADDALRDSLGLAGRRYVEDWYSWDAVMSRYERLLMQSRVAWRSSSAGRMVGEPARFS